MKERLIKFLAYIRMGQTKFEEKVGLSRGFVDKVGDSIREKNLDKINAQYPELNINWLKTGEGEMLKNGNNLPIATKSSSNDSLGIPLIPIDAMAGIANGEISILEIDCERYVVPMFKSADYLIPVRGTSMYPKYSSGDVVACKKIPLQDIFFQWNKVYVLDTNQGVIIKRVAQSELKGHIKLVSENTQYAPFDLNVQHIYAIAIVVGVIRLE
jgi:phage repressor protein C with HTH and peptisase S24 domain